MPTPAPPPVQESPLTKLWEAVTLGLQRRGCYLELGRILKIVILFLVVAMIVIPSWILFGPNDKRPDEATKVNQLRVSVRANQYWYDTGIGVKQGDWLELKAKGEWWNGISTTGPKGDRRFLGLGRPECGLCPVVGGNLGELVGKVDDEVPFRIGNSIEEIATRDGNLFLAMNESTGSCEGGGEGSCYDDNQGFLEVEVTVWRVKSSQIDVSLVQTQTTDKEASNEEQISIQVYANEYWYDTGIQVQSGDQLEFTATGSWSNGRITIGANGSGPPSCRYCIMPEGNLGELIGKQTVSIPYGTSGMRASGNRITTDNTSPFRIGESTVYIANGDGNLLLTMNEEVHSCKDGQVESCYDDNHGFLEVKVTVWRVNSSQNDVRPGQTQMTDNPNITLLRRLAGHSDQVTSIAFSPDGEMLASGSSDKTVKLWDPQTGDLERTLVGHDVRVTIVRFAPDGRAVVSGSGDPLGSYGTSVRMWDVRTGSMKHTLEIVGNYYSGGPDITFSPDGRILVTSTYVTLNHPGGYGYTVVKLWDTQSGEMLIGFGGWSTTRWILSPGGKSLAIIAGMSNPNTTDILNVPTGELKWTLESVGPIIFSPDGKYLAGRGDDKAIQIWDVPTGELKWTLEGSGKVLSISFSPDGKYLASGGDDRTVRLWDTQTWNLLRQLAGHSGEVTWTAFSPDGRTFASQTSDEVVRLWDTEAWEVRQTFEAYSEDVASIDLSPDWRTVIYWNSNNTVSLYDAQTGRAKGVLKEDSGAVREITFSPDGKTLASRGEGKVVSLWHLE